MGKHRSPTFSRQRNFTASIMAERRLRLLVDYIDLLRLAFRSVRRRQAFDIEAIVILPDHLHAIWTILEGDAR
jgi:putative transposase